MTSPALARDLERRSLAMFDDLKARGKLFHEPTEGEVVEDHGTEANNNVYLATIPILSREVILAHNASERRGHGGPFLHPDPDFVVAEVGPHHILELSMHCIYRPAFVLHTREFALQSDDLGMADITAARSVMAGLSSAGPQMATYNCGVEAGASQGHKHMQVLALPSPFPLFPSRAESEQVIASNIPDVPHRHYVLRLPRNSQPDRILSCSGRLLQAMRAPSRTGTASPKAHNVVLTNDWLCVIPRRNARLDSIGANSAGMVGILWLQDQAEAEESLSPNYFGWAPRV